MYELVNQRENQRPQTSGAYESRHNREPRHSAGGHQTKIANALKRYINEIETTALSAAPGYIAP